MHTKAVSPALLSEREDKPLSKQCTGLGIGGRKSKLGKRLRTFTKLARPRRQFEHESTTTLSYSAPCERLLQRVRSLVAYTHREYGQEESVQVRKCSDRSRNTVANFSIVGATRTAEVTSSQFDAPTAQDVRQRTRQSRDSQSETWLNQPLSVGRTTITRRASRADNGPI